MSYLIAAIGILAMWCSGYDDWRRMAGFLLSLTNQVIWVVYALITAQYGFLIGAVVFGAVCVRNIRRHWRRRNTHQHKEAVWNDRNQSLTS